MPDQTPTPTPTPPGDAFVAITTQADFDTRIADRLRREREKFADYDQLKAAAARVPELEQQAADAQGRVEKAQEAAVKAHIVAAAVRSGAVDADTVAALLDKSGIATGDDGTITGIDDAVAALLESKPFLKAAAAPAPPAPSAPASPSTTKPPALAGALSMAEVRALTPDDYKKDPDLAKKVAASYDTW